MSAQENLSQQLFHGTDAIITSGRVKPKLQGEDNRKDIVGQTVAFATNNLDEARAYGKNIYEVIPDEHTEKFNDLGVFINRKGFGIKRLVESRPTSYKRPEGEE